MRSLRWLVMASVFSLLGWPGACEAAEAWHVIFPEQRSMEIREPTQIFHARLPEVPAPETVAKRRPELQIRDLSLDEAIRVALGNSEVVRVLAGGGAGATGSTIYDPAITNTEIDRARALFDPQFRINNTFRHDEDPGGAFFRAPGSLPNTPPDVRIEANQLDRYDMRMGLSKPTVTGGSLDLGVNATPLRSNVLGLPLNPQTSSSVDLGLTQPLLQGGGIRANLAPIEIARIDTERSFFQLKDNVQRLVRSVIEGYWNLVFARTDVWARQQQVEQGQWALDRAEANLRARRADLSDVAQARSALAGFRANLIASEANVIQREAALRNVLGLVPSDEVRLVPITPPPDQRVELDWNELLSVTETYRPDLIEMKLVLEADQQQLIIARNSALPRLDATGLYRWNGLEGRTPDRQFLASDAGQFTGWELGVNFSVPLGLRQGRAALRQRELVILRDRANLEQALHSAAHSLATSYRNLDLFFEQYRAYQQTRTAARANLEYQIAVYRVGQGLFLNVLLAITEWGNAVSAEAQALAQYNAELANLQEQSGRILETHGIRFMEERYGSIGPLGRLADDRCYPKDRQPTANEDRYRNMDRPAENAFGLERPALFGRGKPGARAKPVAPEPQGDAPLPPSPSEPIPVPGMPKP